MTKRLAADFNLRTMFDRAVGFIDASRVLYQVFSKHTPLIGFPMIMNVAFATELMMKVLRTVEAGDGPLQTHNFVKLFADLSNESQQWITAEWDKVNELESLRSDPNYNAVVPDTLPEALDQAAMAFVDWRYPPNDRSIAIHIGPLPAIIANRVLQFHPDWIAPEITFVPAG